jgi:hypothetical protein
MWYPLWASLFGWKVTWTRDAIQITVEVQSNSQAEIQKAQTILSYRNPKWTTQSIQ